MCRPFSQDPALRSLQKLITRHRQTNLHSIGQIHAHAPGSHLSHRHLTNRQMVTPSNDEQLPSSGVFDYFSGAVGTSDDAHGAKP